MNKKQKILIGYFILLPFIDLITSLMTRFTDLPFTIGTIVKGLTLLFGIIYVMFFSNYKGKRKVLVYFGLVIFYAIFYLLTKKDIWQLTNIIQEINTAVKYFYFPLMTISFYIIFKDLKIDNTTIRRILLINTLIYSVLLIIPYLTGTGFNSYYNNYKEGINGWFYAANEIGALLVILSISIYDLMDNNKKTKILLSIPIMFAIGLIGTKLSFLGLIIVVILISFLFIIKNKKQKFILPGFLLIILTICSFTTIGGKNLFNANELYNELVESNRPNTEIKENNNNTNNIIDKDNIENNIDNNETLLENNEIEYKNIDELITNPTINQIVKVMLNGREDFLLKNFAVYKQSGLNNILFGLSWSDRESINYTFPKKLIEIDIMDVLIHYGIIGFIIYFTPFIYFTFELIKNIKKLTLENTLFILIILMSFAMSCFAGHMLGAPSVSIYIILLLIIVINNIKEKEYKNEKEI